MTNILQDITKNLSSLFKGKSKGSVIGVDIGSSSIKIVQLKNENGIAVLETYGAVSFGSYVQNSYNGQAVNPTHDQTIKAISDLIKESNITSFESAVAIPSASSLVFLTRASCNCFAKRFCNCYSS
jgi:Tfp pilus assembly PilM family ATPase